MVMEQIRLRGNNNTSNRRRRNRNPLSPYPLRPLEHKITNIMGVQPSPRQTKSVSEASRRNNEEQARSPKTVNIVLNPPFIKLDVNANRRVQRPKMVEESEESDTEQSSIIKVIGSNAGLGGVKSRVIPSRLCKGRPIPGDQSPDSDTSGCKKFRNKRKRAKVHPSRASYRIYQKLKETADKVQSERKPCLRVTRTVEMINQKNEAWRQEKSKLLYMLGLGLTPILSKPGVELPSVILEPVPLNLLNAAKERYELANAERLAQIKEARHKLRLKRLELFRQRRQQIAQTAGPIEVEVIDLMSDEDESKNSKKELEPDFMLPDYPNLTIEKVANTSKSPAQTMRKRQVQPMVARPRVIACTDEMKTVTMYKKRSPHMHMQHHSQQRNENMHRQKFTPNSNSFKRRIPNLTPLLVITPTPSFSFDAGENENTAPYAHDRPSLTTRGNHRHNNKGTVQVHPNSTPDDDDVIILE